MSELHISDYDTNVENSAKKYLTKANEFANNILTEFFKASKNHLQ